MGFRQSSPDMEVSFIDTEQEFEKETPNKYFDAPTSFQDTEPTMAGTPRGLGLTIKIPQDDDSNSYSGNDVEISDEESKSLTPT